MFEYLAAQAFRRQLERRRHAGKTVLLAFHNIVPDTAETRQVDASLHLPYGQFCAMLDVIQSLPRIRVVSLGEALMDGDSGLRIALTFDDAYRGFMRLGAPALAERGMPATVFVAPGLFGTVPWWDIMRSTVASAVWERRREQWLHAPYQGFADRIIVDATVSHSHLPSRSSDFGIVELEELVESCATGLLRVGCHTWHHPCLPSLTDEACRAELQRSRDWLAASGLPYDLLHAFPYGRWSERDVRILRELGYQRAFMIRGGRIQAPEEFCLPRINIPAGLSPNGLLARIAEIRCDG